MKRAWLLARVSTTKSSQDSSPENQLATLRAYCERKGWRVVGEGQDRMSGAKFDRPALLEAMAAIRAGRADALCVTDLDRLGRDVRELLATADELRDRGVVLVVARLGGEGFVDTSTAMGRMMFTVLAAMAEFFRNLYREKSIEGQQHARQKGKRIGRPPTVLQPVTVMVAMQLRGLVPGGGTIPRMALAPSWRAIAAALAREGHRRPNGRPWAAGTVQRAAEALSRRGVQNAAQQTQ
jgi:DNA invertase Pin-like site-specific DNA recombinase